MGEPKYEDGQFIFDGDLTDHCKFLKEEDPFRCVCPVCGSDNIWNINHVDEGDTLIDGYSCHDCGSEFSFTYWITAVVVRNDGRFNKEA